MTAVNLEKSDWTWFRSVETFSDAEIACLVYPRKLCIEVGTKDDLFDINSVRKEIHRLKDMGSKVNNEWLEVLEFDGSHEFCLEEAPLERFAATLLNSQI